MPENGQTPEVPFDYEMVCKVVGQLFLETRLRIELLNRQVETLTEERNQAIAALVKGPAPNDSTRP